MFPRLRDRLGTALDLMIEFSTLGEYRLAASGVPGPASALAATLEPAPRMGGSGPAAGVAVERIVAGGAAASRSLSSRTPAANPAAKRPQRPCPTRPRRAAQTSAADARRVRSSRETPSRRSGAPARVEQLCFAGV